MRKLTVVRTAGFMLLSLIEPVIVVPYDSNFYRANLSDQAHVAMQSL
jgi:hypothetical protein